MHNDGNKGSDGNHNVRDNIEPNTSNLRMELRQIITVLYLSTDDVRPLMGTRLLSFTEVKLYPDDYLPGWTVRCTVFQSHPLFYA